jgi:hypothetical protein
MQTHSVYLRDPKTGEETLYPSVKQAAEAISVTERHIRQSCHTGYKCNGFYCRYGKAVHKEDKRGKAKPNICFECKKACGGCSWSAFDPYTGKIKYEPVPGWTAEKVLLNIGGVYVETYHIKECPLFEEDEPRNVDYRELTYTESEYFLKNIGYLLKRWEKNGE